MVHALQGKVIHPVKDVSPWSCQGVPTHVFKLISLREAFIFKQSNYEHVSRGKFIHPVKGVSSRVNREVPTYAFT